MKRTRLVPALIALLAITSLSVASTTLDTSLTTDPDDEINPNWDTLPIGQSDAAAIQESIEAGDEDGERAEVADSESDDLGDQEEAEFDDADSDGEADGSEDDAAAGGSGGDVGAESDSDDGTGTPGEERTLFDRLVALLSLLLRLLLPVVAILALGALTYRYRAVLSDIFGSDSETVPTSEPRPAAERWPGTDPDNDVDRAWVAVIRRLDPDRPETTTPDECRALARVRDVDTDGVESIVSAFERVHYGGRSVDTETDRAREGLRALESDAK